MSDDLKSWTKNDLVREVRRLRAIAKEHAATPGDVPVADGGEISGPGGAYDRGAVVLDARNSILLDSVDVSLVDTMRDGADPRLAMVLAGRVNMQQRRARQLYMFDGDGAAAIISELLALASRAGGGFLERLMSRLESVPK